MKFHSGFSLKNESCFFEPFIKDTEYSVCGFSYGAIKAYEEVKESLSKAKRVDTLQLFSPAFFQTKSEKFKRMQTLSYTKYKERYLREFLKGCFAPYEESKVQHSETSLEELEELLYYEWNLNELKELEDKGVSIEVYLGGEDAIIDVKGAREFFEQVATVTYIKDANHFLQIN